MQESQSNDDKSKDDQSNEVRTNFELGWSLAELRGRIGTSTASRRVMDGDAATEKVPDADRFGDELWRGSQWRISFDRVTRLHAGLGLNDKARGTRYDPGTSKPGYAFQDYAISGLIPPDDGQAPLGQFPLREATRRLLNCLDLLYQDARTTLTPDDLARDRKRLLAMLSVGAVNGATMTAIDLVSVDAVTFIDAWSGYLREQLAEAVTNKELAQRCIAYECGHAMASLSWELTSKVLACEKAVDDEQPALQSAWTQAFADRGVSYLQHNLAVLADCLTDPDASVVESVIRSLEIWQRGIVWLASPASRSACGLVEHPFSADLRAALIEQVSIWQALILGQREMKDFTTPAVTTRLLVDATGLVARAANPKELATIENAALNQTHALLDPLVTDVSSTITGITTQITAPIRKGALALVREFWPILVGVPVVLLVALVLIVVSSSGNPLSSVGSILAAVGVMACGVLHVGTVQQQQRADGQAVIDNVKNAVTSADTQVMATLQAKVNDVQGALTSAGKTAQQALGSIEQAAGGVSAKLISSAVDEVTTAVDNASKQVLADLAALECVLALSYPLMDYVVSRMPEQEGGQTNNSPSAAAYQFLTRVVWNEDDRRQELLQVANAAFGPAGVMAVAANFKEEDDQPLPKEHLAEEQRTNGQATTVVAVTPETTVPTTPAPTAAPFV